MWRSKNLWRVLLIAVLMLGVAVPALADGFKLPPQPACPPIEKPKPIPDPPCKDPKVIWLNTLYGSAEVEVQVEGGVNDIHKGETRNLQLQVVQPGNERAQVLSLTLTINGVVVYKETAAFAPPNDRPKYWATNFPYTFTTAGPVAIKLEAEYKHRPGTHVVTVDKKYCLDKYIHTDWKYVPCEWEWCWWHFRWELKSAAKYVKVYTEMKRLCLCEITYQKHVWRDSDHADLRLNIGL